MGVKVVEPGWYYPPERGLRAHYYVYNSDLQGWWSLCKIHKLQPKDKRMLFWLASYPVSYFCRKCKAALQPERRDDG